MPFLDIQSNVYCEPCKDCGARPVIEQLAGKFSVRCPQSNAHFKTNYGLIDIADWNSYNKLPVTTTKQAKVS